ncbi:MAG: hypothetical protein R3B91_01295 [Planctomycetaceae bacterium]
MNAAAAYDLTLLQGYVVKVSPAAQVTSKAEFYGRQYQDPSLVTAPG